MPNWSNNAVTITGDIADLEGLASKPFNFESVMPTPEELKVEGWYDWRCRNWGTKWDIEEDVHPVVVNGAIEMSFATAWCPPTDLFVHLVKQRPSLKVVIVYETEDPCYGYVVIDKDEIRDVVIQSGCRMMRHTDAQFADLVKEHPQMESMVEWWKDERDEEEEDEEPWDLDEKDQWNSPFEAPELRMSLDRWLLKTQIQHDEMDRMIRESSAEWKATAAAQKALAEANAALEASIEAHKNLPATHPFFT
jgi:hypothetical protein